MTDTQTNAHAALKDTAHKMRSSITTLLAISRNIGRPLEEADMLKETAIRKCHEMSEFADTLDEIAQSLTEKK